MQDENHNNTNSQRQRTPLYIEVPSNLILVYCATWKEILMLDVQKRYQFVYICACAGYEWIETPVMCPIYF